MPDLIIGHTCETSARVWFRGDAKNTVCEVSLHLAGNQASRNVFLDPDTDYTATVVFEDLQPGVDYVVDAAFFPSGVRVHGRLCTMRLLRDSGADTDAFTFVLSSCNLSVVSINDFLSFLAASAGISIARSSLKLPFHRWKRPRLDWLKVPLRFLLDCGIQALAFFVNLFTDIKQPGPPFLRSPFLKLSAVFDSTVLNIALPPSAPRAEASDEPPAPPFLAVGDRVQSSFGATGVVASLGYVVTAELTGDVWRDAAAGPNGDASEKTTREMRRLVVTQVQGSFERGGVLFRKVTSNSHDRLDRLGMIAEAAPGRPWFEPPSFFIHAGDQIYFDFPSPSRQPDRNAYRLAYREAWFEDLALRHVLAHWPHYMTLDDHEIADQFALDFKPPNEQFRPNKYLQEASLAYRDYAHALSPPQRGGQPVPKCGPYWYTFNKRRARFFVLDTRTRRSNARGELIDPEQLKFLLAWMVEDPHDLKFVVTSVPFVAEVNEENSDRKPDWFKDTSESAQDGGEHTRTPEDTPPPRRNSEHDKWSAFRFKAQRDQIIEHIAANGIEHLVFLTGDMHCCYHATMRIGNGLKKYESITVHELAGGPVNQLQLAGSEVFDLRSTKHTGRTTRDGVDYESTLERFHGDVSAVMHVKIEHKPRLQVFEEGAAVVPEIEWNVIRTLTDPGPTGWLPGPEGQRSLDLRASGPPIGESVMAGRISFVKKRLPEDLQQWPKS